MIPRLSTIYRDQVRDSYNAELRRRRIKRAVAALCVCAASFQVALTFALLVATASSALVTAIAANIYIAGFFGARYLITRH